MDNNKTRILIVEDERIIGLDIKKNLERVGYEIINIVNTGEAAIDLAGAFKTRTGLNGYYAWWRYFRN